MEGSQSELYDMIDCRKFKKKGQERMVVMPIHKPILQLINVPLTLKIVFKTLFDISQPGHDQQDKYPVIYVSHYEVIHYLMSFLVSTAFSTDIFTHLSLFNFANNNKLTNKLTNKNGEVNFAVWLRLLTLETTESVVRQESCQALYKLCLGRSVDGMHGYKHLPAVFNCLLLSFDEACALKWTTNTSTSNNNITHNRGGSSCHMSNNNSPIGFNSHKNFENKAPQGPGCRDYLWLLCQFVEAVKKQDAEVSWMDDSMDGYTSIHHLFDSFDLSKMAYQLVSLSGLCDVVRHKINTRTFNEKRQNTVEDEGLVGLMKLCETLLKHNPPFKHCQNGGVFLHEIFQCLFALPSPSRLHLPKCNSHNSRLAAYDLLVELVKFNTNNYTSLHALLLQQNHKGFLLLF